MLLPTRITRYMLGEVLKPTLLGLGFFSFILLMNYFFIVAERSLSKNLSFDVTQRLFLTFLPSVLVLAIPMSVLFGCLIAVGRVSADQEWVALQGAGQGPWCLLKPILGFGLAASLLSMYVYSELVPESNYSRRALNAEIILSSSLAADLKPRTFYTELQDSVLYVEDIVAGAASEDGAGPMRGIVLIRSRPKDEYDVVVARSGDILPMANQTGGLLADLHHGNVVRFSLREPVSDYGFFETYPLDIPPPPHLKSLLEPPDKVVSDMETRDLLAEAALARQKLRETVEGLRALGRDPEDRQARFLADNRVVVSTVELHARLALPLAALFLAALAVPLGITRARSGKGAGLAVCLIVIAIYWPTYTFARSQALAGKIPAWLGPWMSNLLMVPWAALLLWRMRRPRESESGVLGRIRRLYGWLRGLLRTRRSPGGSEDATEETLQTFSGTTSRFVIRIDSYVGGHYLRILAYAVVLAYLITFLGQLKGLAEGLLRTQQSPRLLFDYFKYFAPSMLHIVLPVACLIGAVVAFTLLARTGELTAVKATGVSVWRVTLPVVVLTAFLCVFLYFVEDFVAPSTNRKAQEAEDRIMGRAPQTYSAHIGGRWGFGPNGETLYHFRLFDAEKQEFQNLTVFTIDRSEPRIVDHLFAQRARWVGETAELEQGWYRTFDADVKRKGTYQLFDKMQKVILDPPEELLNKQLALSRRSGLAEQMSLEDLHDEIGSLEDRGYETTHLQMAFHGKIARTASPLVMVLLGLPFAFRVGRRGSLYGVGVALLLVLVYWAVFAVFNALGLQTLLDPWIAAWAPNVLFGLLGTYLLLYVPT